MKIKIYLWQKFDALSRFAIILLALLSSKHLFADGSRDLYPLNASGVRAQLRSSNAPTVNWPFPNQGFHYVYAKAGERITLASSTQNAGGNARIQLFSPANVSVVNSTTLGRIADRTEELAGPQLFGQTGGGRYTPLYYVVPSGGAGIYRVEFSARGTNDPQGTVNANDNWNQTADDAGILAWDVSVINTANTQLIPGRVYANVLNFSNGTGQVNTNGFYGKMYPLTKDGYTYRVDNNGNNGIYFTFFVNNNGFLDPATQLPIYKSLTSTNTAFLTGKVQDPNTADTALNITHKMFYTLPSSDLPTSSIGAVPGGTTWLKNPVIVPVVTNLSLTGVEGTPGQISNKGGYIKFNADLQGSYKIVIEATPANPGFVTRTLTGPSTAGANQIYWDSKDGAGNAAPVGTYPIVSITVTLQQGEVHFPYIDMEYNRLGTILELLDHTNLTGPPLSNIVYWNDVDIPDVSNGSNSSPKNNGHLPPANSTGISSVTNGHKWGVLGTGTSGQFGDNRSIDTYTFIKGQETTLVTSVTVKSADLMVSSIVPNKTNADLGDQVAYTIKVKNGGPSDVSGAKFTFKISNSFTPQSIVFNANGCGSQSVALTYDAATHTYTSNLVLPTGCEITYTINVIVNTASTAGNQNVEAAILRTNDVTDPDATDPDVAVLPTNAQSECTNNGLGGTCNNIKTNNSLIVTLPCYDNPNTTGAATSTKHGITLLQRAGGTTNTDWPMLRNSGFTALESNTRGFVISRLSPTEISALTAQEGMMVYDTTANCLKIFDGAAWSCFSRPACP